MVLGARRERLAASVVVPHSVWHVGASTNRDPDDVSGVRAAVLGVGRTPAAAAAAVYSYDASKPILVCNSNFFACIRDAQQVGCMAAPSELAVTDLVTPAALQKLFIRTRHTLEIPEPVRRDSTPRRPWP